MRPCPQAAGLGRLLIEAYPGFDGLLVVVDQSRLRSMMCRESGLIGGFPSPPWVA